MSRLLRRVTAWRMFRDVTVTDIDLASAEGRVYLVMHTRSRWKPVINAEVTRAELESLTEVLANELFGEGVSHFSEYCWSGSHDWCQAERNRTRRDGHGACCRTDANRCGCGCHPDQPIEPEPAGPRRQAPPQQE